MAELGQFMKPQVVGYRTDKFYYSWQSFPASEASG